MLEEVTKGEGYSYRRRRLGSANRGGKGGRVTIESGTTIEHPEGKPMIIEGGDGCHPADSRALVCGIAIGFAIAVVSIALGRILWV